MLTLATALWLSSASATELDCTLLASPSSEIADAIMARPADERAHGIDQLLDATCDTPSPTRSLHVARRVAELYGDDPELRQRLVLALSNDRTAEAAALKPDQDPEAKLVAAVTPDPEDVRREASLDPYSRYVATMHHCSVEVSQVIYSTVVDVEPTDTWVVMVGTRPVDRRDFRQFARRVAKGHQVDVPVERRTTPSGGLSMQSMAVEIDAYNARLRSIYDVTPYEGNALVHELKPAMHAALRRIGCSFVHARTLLDANR